MLPVELLINILSFTDPFTLSNIKSSCRLFRDILQDKNIWLAASLYHLTNDDSCIKNTILNSYNNWQEVLAKRQLCRQMCFRRTMIQNKQQHINTLLSHGKTLESSSLIPISSIANAKCPRFAQITKTQSMQSYYNQDDFQQHFDEQSTRIMIYDTFSGNLSGQIIDMTEIVMTRSFTKDGQEFLITVDSSRCLKIYDISHEPFSQIHSIQFASNQAIRDLIILTQNSNTSLINNPSRNNSSSSPNRRISELFNDAQVILATLSESGRVEFRPIWFEIMDRGPYGGESLYPYVERDPYLTVHPGSHQSAAKRLWTVKYGIGYLNIIGYADGTLTLSLISHEKNCSVSVVSNQISLVHANSQSFRQQTDVCTNTTSADFLHVIAMGSNNWLYEWDLRNAIPTNSAYKIDTIEITPCRIIREDIISYYVNWNHAVVFYDALRVRNRIIRAFDRKKNIGNTLMLHEWSIKSMLFLHTDDYEYPTLAVENRTGTVELVSLDYYKYSSKTFKNSLVKLESCSSEMMSTTNSATQQEKGMVAQWLQEITDF